MPNLSIDEIVRVNIAIAEANDTEENGCNTGLILGKSTAISTDDRVKEYTSVMSMITDGFSPTSDEAKAAEYYFAQRPAPKKVYVGRFDSSNDGTALDALKACYSANSSYYGVYYAGGTDAQNITIAKALQTNFGDNLMLFYETSSEDCYNSSVLTDPFTQLKVAGVKNACGIYSEQEGAAAALMGLACGLETGEAGSAFDLYFKKLVDIEPSDLTQVQVNAISAKGGNVYVTRGQKLMMVEPGQCANGVAYDEVMYQTLTKKILQGIVLNTLASTSTPKIPQTDEGMAVIISAVTTGMEKLRAMGVYAAGTWTADSFRSISTGDMLPSGYAIFVDSFDTLSSSERSLRMSPPIYIAAKLAGSVRSVVINLSINE